MKNRTPKEAAQFADRELDRGAVILRLGLLLWIIRIALRGILISIFEQGWWMTPDRVFDTLVLIIYIIAFFKWQNGVTVICREIIKAATK